MQLMFVRLERAQPVQAGVGLGTANSACQTAEKDRVESVRVWALPKSRWKPIFAPVNDRDLTTLTRDKQYGRSEFCRGCDANQKRTISSLTKFK